MADPFINYREAARASLAVKCLSEKEGQFCGDFGHRTSRLGQNQLDWLCVLFARQDLPLRTSQPSERELWIWMP